MKLYLDRKQKEHLRDQFLGYYGYKTFGCDHYDVDTQSTEYRKFRNEFDSLFEQFMRNKEFGYLFFDHFEKLYSRSLKEKFLNTNNKYICKFNQ